MKIKNLLKNINYETAININAGLTIKGLSHECDNVAKGFMFFCIKGTQSDGHNFAKDAVKNGAECIIVERIIKELSVMQIVVKDTRIAMSEISKYYYDMACDRLNIVGVVGTNGKSSVSMILQSILENDGQKTAIIGTDGTFVGDIKFENKLTTPDPIELHYLFKQLVNLNVKNVIIEVSVQSIYFNKLYGINFFAGILTNISAEHLDFFKSYESYVSEKLSFFSKFNVENVILNADCNESFALYSEILLNNESLKGKVSQITVKKNDKKKDSVYVLKHYDMQNLITYGIYNPSDTFAMDIKTSIRGSRFIVNCNDEIYELNTRLVGVYNIYNILSVLNVCNLLGVDMSRLPDYIKEIKSLPGRYNVYNLDCNNKVIIDYAHTTGAYKEVLSLTKKLRTGRLIAVFGCVGYSDKEKRFNIGSVVAEYCDEAIITTDNLLNADFYEVYEDILLGMKSKKSVVTDISLQEKNKDDINECNADMLVDESDTKVIKVYSEFNREEAIYLGLTELKENDTLLILGKGVEEFNKIKNEKIKHNDKEALNKSIQRFYGVKQAKPSLVN